MAMRSIRTLLSITSLLSLSPPPFSTASTITTITTRPRRPTPTFGQRCQPHRSSRSKSSLSFFINDTRAGHSRRFIDDKSLPRFAHSMLGSAQGRRLTLPRERGRNRKRGETVLAAIRRQRDAKRGPQEHKRATPSPTELSIGAVGEWVETSGRPRRWERIDRLTGRSFRFLQCHGNAPLLVVPAIKHV